MIWPAEAHFESYGVRLTVRVTDPSFLPELERHFPPRWSRSDGLNPDQIYEISTSETSDGSVHTLWRGAREVVRTARRDLLIDRFASDVHHCVAEHSSDLLFIHAGVVGWEGRALLLPGRSQAGKSRLVEALVRAGAQYYSDEFAPFDDAGLVHPYPKLLARRVTAGEPRQWQSTEAFGPMEKEPIPVGLVAALRYDPEEGWNVRDLTQGQGMLALFDNTVLAQTRPGDALRIFSTALGEATVLTGTRGDADEARDRLLARHSNQGCADAV